MKRAAVVVGALLLIALVMALRGPSGELGEAGGVQSGASDAPYIPAEDAQSPSAVSDESVADAVGPTTGDAGTPASLVETAPMGPSLAQVARTRSFDHFRLAKIAKMLQGRLTFAFSTLRPASRRA